MTAQEQLDMLEDLARSADFFLKEMREVNRSLGGELDNAVSALATALDETTQVVERMRPMAEKEAEQKREEQRRDYFRSIGGAY